MIRLLFYALLVLFGVAAKAQKVAFPQQQQPGEAVLTTENGVYTLSNELFSASFRKSSGTLIFDGCAEMGLKPGTELFSITLGDGRIVNASEMTLGSVTTKNLSPDASQSICVNTEFHLHAARGFGHSCIRQWRNIVLKCFHPKCAGGV